ncbi:glycosyltransferase [Rhodocaloribacter sp.]
MSTTPLISSTPAAPPEAADGVLDLSVIIVNYNVREFLEQALRSVRRAAEGLSVEVFVVDNNSVDGSVEMIRRDFPEVHLIANAGNAGFGRANNQAIRRARGRHLLILNPDTIVQEDTFATLLRFMETHPEAGAVGCQILNPDGAFAPESRRAFPTPPVAFYRMTGLSRLFPKSRRFGRYNLTYLPVDEVAEVDALSGSCMLVRHAALYFAPETLAHEGEEAALRTLTAAPPAERRVRDGAGLFDEDFFMYGEDLDWCFRIQRAGWKIFYTPETQIIHYKGESTKKGELRYVRHFYGAMILFTQKHFQDRYSRLFAGVLQAGIMFRAVLTVLAGGLRRLAPPLTDFLLVYGIVTLVGYLRAWSLGAALSPLFLATVAPGYGLGAVAGIAPAGGYRRGGLRRIRPALVGALTGLLAVAAASFFVKEIAFSRVVVLVSFPVVALALAVRRFVRHARTGTHRAVLVGRGAEAARLRGMLAGHPNPPFELTGYLAPDDAPDDDADAPPRLGSLRHLRDLVRLRRIDDVVFAEDGLSHRAIFRLMQQLRDLPVQFRILAQGREHVIGKASIDDLSTPLLEADRAVGTLRTVTARRAFELPVALVGLLAHPFVWAAARLAGPRSFAARLAHRTRRMPAVLAGRRALVGFRPEDPFRPPPEWDLPPAVFSIAETLRLTDPAPKELNRAFWFYVSRQSASLDWDILVRSLRNMYHEKGKHDAHAEPDPKP